MNGYIDNSALIPSYRPDDQVQMEGWHPDWIGGLIMAQMRVESATDEGTFAAAVKVLDHYREMGVNAMWLTPIQDKGTSGNGYSNMGPHTVNPALTGCDSYEESWKVVKWFVDEAHKRDIRIYLDLIVWGTVKESPLVTAHPDWYAGFLEVWGGYKFNWYSDEFKTWFFDRAEKIVLDTGIDGFRVDLEPFVTGHKLFAALRRRLLEKGRKISIMAECTSERDEAYDFDEQITNEDPERWHMHTMFTKRHNIVDAVKNGWGHGTIYAQENDRGGRARFYCLCLSCHDNPRPCIEQDRLIAGYGAVFGPYIPLWFIGDDWGNLLKPGCGMFNNYIDWSRLDLPENRAFYEDFKRMLRIRRQYPEIFTFFPEDHRNANIEKVTSDCPLQAYARYAGQRAVIVLPNDGTAPLAATAAVDPAAIGLKADKACRYTLLFPDTELTADGDTLHVTIPARSLAVVLAEQA